MEIWIPLISACIGGLIATIPLLLGLMVQIYVYVSENRQKKKEARTQLELELVRNDIQIVELETDNSLRQLQIIADFSLKRWDKKLSVQEMKEQIKSAFFDETGKIHQLGDADIGADRRARTLGDEIYAEYKHFGDLTMEYWKLVVNDASVWDELKKENELYESILNSGGKLHALLRDKLISIRDT